MCNGNSQWNVDNAAALYEISTDTKLCTKTRDTLYNQQSCTGEWIGRHFSQLSTMLMCSN